MEGATAGGVCWCFSIDRHWLLFALLLFYFAVPLEGTRVLLMDCAGGCGREREPHQQQQ